MKEKSRKNRSLTLVLALLFGVIIAFVGVIVCYQARRAPKAKSTAQTVSTAESAGTAAPQQEESGVDAEQYYRENSQKLLRVIPAKDFAQLYSEKAVEEELSARGFGGKYPITYEYDMDGERRDKTEVDKASSEAHPQYTVMYTTKSGDYWTISVCGDSVTAYPVTYNLEHGDGTELVFAESDSITAYDSRTNSFYETVPKQSVLVIKQLPAITADALEQLTAQEIKKR